MLPLIARFVDKVRPGSLVIDLGCGSGRDLQSFSAQGLRPIGLDYAEPLARYAHQTTSLPLVIADLRWLPCRSSAVDGVWAAASLLHLRRDELMEALTEIRRVLKPGAPFFASLKRGIGEGRDARSRWFTYFERAEWNAVLQTAGFVDIEVGDDQESRPRPACVAAVDWLVSFARAPRAGTPSRSS
ncbi:MAG: class I SAM-dependent methyltransferase [Gammaproteobacteria bacterium]